jgi:hypothetical protein
LIKANNIRFVVIFHRNLLDLHRGQGVYLRRLVSLLSQYFDTYVIDSNGFRKFGFSNEIPKLSNSFFHDFKNSTFSFIKWILTEKERGNCIVLSEDFYISIFVVPISILFKIKTIYRSSDFGVDYRKNLLKQIGIKLKILPILMNIAEIFICKISNMIIVPSSDERELMIKSGISPEKVDIYPHRAHKINFTSEEIQNFKQDNALLNKTIITFIGNMDYKPNVEAALFVIKLANEHFEKFPDDHVIYIVCGKNSDQMRKFSTNFLRVLGEVNDVNILLSASDIGLNPSLVPGGSSIKIIDYLVNGLVVISTEEGNHGIIHSDRIIVCNRKEFLEKIRDIADEIRNGRFKREPIPANITDYYLSDKWGIDIAEKMQHLWLQAQS